MATPSASGILRALASSFAFPGALLRSRKGAPAPSRSWFEALGSRGGRTMRSALRTTPLRDGPARACWYPATCCRISFSKASSSALRCSALRLRSSTALPSFSISKSPPAAPSSPFSVSKSAAAGASPPLPPAASLSISKARPPGQSPAAPSISKSWSGASGSPAASGSVSKFSSSIAPAPTKPSSALPTAPGRPRPASRSARSRARRAAKASAGASKRGKAGGSAGVPLWPLRRRLGLVSDRRLGLVPGRAAASARPRSARQSSRAAAAASDWPSALAKSAHWRRIARRRMRC